MSHVITIFVVCKKLLENKLQEKKHFLFKPLKFLILQVLVIVLFSYCLMSKAKFVSCQILFSGNIYYYRELLQEKKQFFDEFQVTKCG